MPLTKREAAVVSAYTGYLIGDFQELHLYIEELMGHPVLTHEIPNLYAHNTIRDKSKADFISIPITEE